MTTRYLHLSLLLGLGFIAGCDDDIAPPVTRNYPSPSIVASSQQSQPDVAIYAVHGSGSGGAPNVIFSVDPDGRLVWSESRLEGGGTLKEARLSQNQLLALRDRLTATARTLGRSELAYTGPDASFTAVEFQMSNGERAKYSSWHEYAEVGGLVATEGGIAPRGFVGEEDQQAPEAARYAEFRAAWREFREAIEQAIRDADPPALSPQ